MMKKKMIAGIIAAAAMTSMVLPVYGQSPSNQMKVQYQIPSSYEIRIPGNVALQKGSSTECSIVAEKMNIEPLHKLHVKISAGIDAEGKVTLKRVNGSDTDTTTSVISLTKEGQGINGNTPIAIFSGQEETPKTGGTIYFSGMEDGLPAGDWNGTITFSFELVKAVG